MLAPESLKTDVHLQLKLVESNMLTEISKKLLKPAFLHIFSISFLFRQLAFPRRQTTACSMCCSYGMWVEKGTDYVGYRKGSLD